MSLEISKERLYRIIISFDLWRIIDAKVALKAQREDRISRERQSRKVARLEEGVGLHLNTDIDNESAVKSIALKEGSARIPSKDKISVAEDDSAENSCYTSSKMKQYTEANRTHDKLLRCPAIRTPDSFLSWSL